MDSAVLLDLLGNENRRRILRLLSHKPCYVTEISEYLNVSPKAVIDHLRKLEEAGLVESRTDDQRRKYFNIAQNVRLEVNVSPYGFGTKSAYPASPTLELTGRCSHLSIDAEPRQNGDDLESLAREFGRLESIENELSLAQRWVHGRMTDVLDRLNDRIGTDADSRFYAKVLAAVAGGATNTLAVAKEVGAPPEVVEQVLDGLYERGLLTRTDDQWTVR
ncbi:MarR family transcriptional regulator [Haloprofundus marisrubri]|uniref:MarR family transcriptional regulator n=1 Tax=Haloprofundus marisrubri TaxID=1514971 RepID=A0A0W1R7S8_9EURY|nr:metalloregulator ArsR/SmtB family transcription factor [Haloprofundus marisrubri]KTG09482.1 MarR family transcriptional regulator [Haloprofundus marisrubri]